MLVIEKLSLAKDLFEYLNRVQKSKIYMNPTTLEAAIRPAPELSWAGKSVITWLAYKKFIKPKKKFKDANRLVHHEITPDGLKFFGTLGTFVYVPEVPPLSERDLQNLKMMNFEYRTQGEVFNSVCRSLYRSLHLLVYYEYLLCMTKPRAGDAWRPFTKADVYPKPDLFRNTLNARKRFSLNPNKLYVP